MDSLGYEDEFFYDNREASAISGMEQNIYTGLREQIDDFESKTDLFNYVEDEIDLASDSMLPSPLDLLMRPIDRMFESHREMVFHELFEQAAEEFEQDKIPESRRDFSDTESVHGP